MQVATWLSELVPPPPVDRSLIEQLREHLDAAATVAVAALPAELLPMRLPKSRLAELDRCARSAVASARPRARDDSMTDAALRGVAVDRFVAHQLVAGRVLDPVEALRSMLSAEGEWSSLAHLDTMTESAAAELVDPLATLVADSWSGIDPAWAPRAQSRAMVVLAEGAAVCSSIVDVELGGPSTDLPSVVVEVKSGRPVASHQSEAYLYGLLVALRDGTAPVEVARWYPGSDIAAVPVSAGLLESAAVRLEDGLGRWSALSSGATPDETPGVWCRWCPDAEVCPSAGGDPGGHEGGGPGGPGGPGDTGGGDPAGRPSASTTPVGLAVGVEGPELLHDDLDDPWVG